MGELIDHPYRHFSPELIERLIAAGYLARSQQHDSVAVKRAFERITKDGKKAFHFRWLPPHIAPKLARKSRLRRSASQSALLFRCPVAEMVMRRTMSPESDILFCFLESNEPKWSAARSGT